MEQLSLSQPNVDYQLLRKLVRALLILTIILVYLPLNPAMPRSGGDFSWMFGMNQAESQHLVFGKDIVFTLGPYASVYTKVYHPDTDSLMLFGGLVLALCNVLLVYSLTKSRSIIWHLFFIAFFAAGMFSRDVLLYMYPLLVALYVYQSTGAKTPLNQTFVLKVTYAALFIPFGLLVLVKGSTLVQMAGITALCMLLFWKRKMKKLAVATALIPIFSAVIFTVIAHQPVSGLWDYIKNMIPITDGYSQAMYVNGPNGEIIWYAIASVFILFFCYRTKDTSLESKLFLTLSVALYLFTAFKGGFTRHDSHALTSAASILLLAFLLYTVLRHKYLFIGFLVSAFAWVYISFNYVGMAVFDVFKPVPGIYSESLEGLIKRISGSGKLKQAYYDRLADIRKEEPHIPALQGTTDLYSYEQSYLLATENKWSPRPVIQGYSVYTDKLAEMNEEHLIGPTAPDNIIFRLQTIDYRQPSLDDGLSWPTIINNYQPGNIDAGFMYLKKKRAQNIRPRKTELYKIACKMYQEVTMPDTTQVLFAEFDMKQTFLGSIVTGLYQPDPLTIYITLTDGTKKNFRFIPIMSKSGFILSPVVENIDEFALLFNDPGKLKNKAIKSFRIANDGEGIRSKFTSWKGDYILHLSKFDYDK